MIACCALLVSPSAPSHNAPRRRIRTRRPSVGTTNVYWPFSTFPRCSCLLIIALRNQLTIFRHAALDCAIFRHSALDTAYSRSHALRGVLLAREVSLSLDESLTIDEKAPRLSALPHDPDGPGIRLHGDNTMVISAIQDVDVPCRKAVALAAPLSNRPNRTLLDITSANNQKTRGEPRVIVKPQVRIWPMDAVDDRSDPADTL